MMRRFWTGSLRFRLLAATLVAVLVALVLAGLLLGSLFRSHVQRQFADTLTAQLDQVTARLEFDSTGQPQLDPNLLADPRWSRPYSGLYWQIDAAGPGAVKRAQLRSRSLWDTTLEAPLDELAPGPVHVHTVTGPAGTELLLVERTVQVDGATGGSWRVLVAADLSPTEAAVTRFNGVLALSLLLLLALSCAAALAQVAVGLAPLRALNRALADIQGGRTTRVQGQFPAEVQPLIDNFNAVLDRNAEVVTRARTQAGNLAHAIKTPLAAMAQAARVSSAQGPSELSTLVLEQVTVARRHVDWHLARSRAAASQGVPGTRADVAPALAGLLRVMAQVHAERQLTMNVVSFDPELAFAGEAQDLQEMLGNVLDNACQWARHTVQVSAQRLALSDPPRLQITVEDDGPGIETSRRDAVMNRGARLDESVPGSGLGLAIVNELVGLYGGQVDLQDTALGGLRVVLTLPAADVRISPPAPAR